MAAEETKLESVLRRTVGSQGSKGETLLENATAGQVTVIEDDIQQYRNDCIEYLERDFGKYVIREPMPVASAEADLFLANDRDTGVEVVIKHYRFGVVPKVEIAQKIQGPGCDHIIGLLETGEKGGRVFEVIEYAPFGTLENLLEDIKREESLQRETLGEIAAAINYLHGIDIIHRDIKPSNILLRRRDPLNLVLTDFGISSETHLSLHLTTTNRTITYSAPEALVGVVAQASDWWSLGIIILEMTSGRHPFADMTETAVNFHLVSKPVPVPENLPEEWQQLIKGLLTRDQYRRWGYPEIQRWLDGETIIPLDYESETEGGVSTGISTKPYRFEDSEFVDPQSLAEAFAKDWREAIQHIERRYVESWLANDLGDQQRAKQLGDLLEDSELHRDCYLSLALLILNTDLPLVFKGEVVSREWMVSNVRDSIRMLESTFPDWHRKLTGDSWIADLRDHRISVINELEPHYDLVKESGQSPTRPPISMGRSKKVPAMAVSEIANQYILNEPQEIIEGAAKFREGFHKARHPYLAKLLKQSELRLYEAILLLCAPRDLYLTRRQSDFRALSQYGLSLDLARVEQLLDCIPEEVVEQAISFREKFAYSNNERLQECLRVEELSLPDAIALLTCDPEYLVTEEQCKGEEQEKLVKERFEKLRSRGWPVDREYVKALFPFGKSEVVQEALKFRQDYRKALDPNLHALLKKGDLSYAEAFALLASPRDLYVTKLRFRL